MPKNDDDEKFNFIPAQKLVDEWMKDPEFVKEYERQKPEFEREWQRGLAKDARVARRKAMLAKLRGVWAYLTRGVGGEVL